MNPRLLCIVLVVFAFGSACGSTDPTDSSAAESTGSQEDLAAWCLSWNAGPISDSEGTEQAMQAILTRAREQAAVAPPEIAAASAIDLASTELFVRIMQTNGFDDSLVTPEQMEQLEPTPEDLAALDQLEEFSSNCP